MEWILWVLYLSGEAWILGWVVMLPMAAILYPWWFMLGSWNFIEVFLGVGDIGQWFMGPFLRYFITQPFIFFCGLLSSIIPGWNFISSFLFGWWAVLDYYSYSYELFAGPTLPAPAPAA
jgi:hypothetical protein